MDTISQVWVQPAGPNVERGRQFCINLSQDNQQIIYSSLFHVIGLNHNTPKSSLISNEHTGSVQIVKKSGNSDTFVSADSLGKLRVWNLEDPAKNLWAEDFVQGICRDFAFDSTNNKICWVTDAKGQGVFGKVLDHSKKITIGKMEGNSAEALTCEWPNNSKFVFTAGQDCAVTIWNVQPFKLLQKKKAHTNMINCLRASPNGEQMVSVSADKSIGFWNLKDTLDPEPEYQKDAHAGGIYSVSWLNDTSFATCSGDKSVKVWNFSNKECLHTLTNGSTIRDMPLGLAYGDKYLVSLSLGGTFNIWNSADLTEPARQVDVHCMPIVSITKCPKTQSIFSIDQNSKVARLNMADGQSQQVFHFEQKGRALTSCAHLNGVSYLTSYQSLMKHDWANGADLTEIFKHEFTLNALVACGSMLAGCDSKGNVLLIDPEAKTAITQVLNEGNTSKVICLASDGQGSLWCGDENGFVYRLDEKTLARKHEPINVGSKATAMACGSNGLVVIGNGAGKTIWVQVSDDSCKVVSEQKYHGSFVTAVCFNGDCSNVWTCGYDGNIVHWNNADFSVLGIVNNSHRGGPVNCGVWNDSAKMLLTGGNDALLIGWAAN